MRHIKRFFSSTLVPYFCIEYKKILLCWMDLALKMGLLTEGNSFRGIHCVLQLWYKYLPIQFWDHSLWNKYCFLWFMSSRGKFDSIGKRITRFSGATQATFVWYSEIMRLHTRRDFWYKNKQTPFVKLTIIRKISTDLSLENCITWNGVLEPTIYQSLLLPEFKFLNKSLAYLSSVILTIVYSKFSLRWGVSKLGAS